MMKEFDEHDLFAAKAAIAEFFMTTAEIEQIIKDVFCAEFKLEQHSAEILISKARSAEDQFNLILQLSKSRGYSDEFHDLLKTLKDRYNRTLLKTSPSRGFTDSICSSGDGGIDGGSAWIV
jgi:hypothetical protein